MLVSFVKYIDACAKITGRAKGNSEEKIETRDLNFS
jgi:hypothetical protein